LLSEIVRYLSFRLKYVLRDSALEETAGVSWETLRRQQFVLAQGAGLITVLARVIKMCIDR